MDYNKNLKPVVKVPEKKEPIKQYNTNLSPVVKPASSNSAFGENLMPKNGVTNSSSGKMQQASKLSGRVGTGSEHKTLA